MSDHTQCKHPVWKRRSKIKIAGAYRTVVYWRCAACDQVVFKRNVGGYLEDKGTERPPVDLVDWVAAGSAKECRERAKPGQKKALKIMLSVVLAAIIIPTIGWFWSIDAVKTWTPNASGIASLANLPPAEMERRRTSALQGLVADYQTTGQRIHDVGWRMLVAGADVCEHSAPTFGLSLSDENKVPHDPEYNTIFGGNLSSVGFVAKGSPAALAGVETGDQIMAINGRDLSNLTKLDDVVSAITDAGKAAQPVSITLRRGGRERQLSMTPMLACPQRLHAFQSNVENAWTDAQANINVWTPMAQSGVTDDEIAYVIGHEIGHMVVRMRQDDLPWRIKLAKFFLRSNETLPRRIAWALNSDQHTVELMCDVVGVRLAQKAGFDQAGAISMTRHIAFDDLNTASDHPPAAIRMVYESAAAEAVASSP